MHPILAYGRRLALYLVFWALFGSLLAALFSIEAGLTRWAAALIALPLAMIYGSVCLSAWYVSRSLPLARTGTIRIGVTAMTSAIVTSGAWLIIARGWLRILEWLEAIEDAAGRAAGKQPQLFGFGVLLYLLSLAVSYLLVAFEQSKEAERRGLEVQVFAREAELRSLRAQIDPHFLFNCLHSISALTTLDPPAARRMCVLLAEFLRESLALGAEARITLGQELRLAARFLDVERVRFGDRLQVAIDAGGADRFLVPPLLLQPIVENAVTHGVAHMVHGGTIRIRASATPAALRISVDNPCDPDRPRGTGTGVGLANVRARLRALHADGARVSASEVDGVWRVEVVLPPAEADPSMTQVVAAHD
jgi:signal transduction histidine kinase